MPLLMAFVRVADGGQRGRGRGGMGRGRGGAMPKNKKQKAKNWGRGKGRGGELGVEGPKAMRHPPVGSEVRTCHSLLKHLFGLYMFI